MIFLMFFNVLNVPSYLLAVFLIFGPESIAQKYLLLPNLKVQHHNREDGEYEMDKVREGQKPPDIH